MRRGRFAKVVALLLVVSMGWLASGCFGKFQLTRKVYEVNQSVEDKYLRSAVTWLFVIIPVYGVSALLDFLLFNLIEFWSGQNPITAAPSTKVYAKGDETVTMTLAREGDATVATIERRKGGTLLSTLVIRDEGKGSVTSDLFAPGKETARSTAAVLADGSMEVTTLSRAGAKAVRHPASAVETYLARAARIAGEVRKAVPGAAGAGHLASPSRMPAFQG